MFPVLSPSIVPAHHRCAKKNKKSRTLFILFSTYYLLNTYHLLGFPGGSNGKASVCNAGDLGIQFLAWEDPLEKEMAPHSSTLAWKILWMEEAGRL